jgi:hypothetical protein
VYRADAAVVYRPATFGHLKMDVAGAHHRCRLFTPPPLRIQTTFDSALAITQDFRVTSSHSKCLSSLAWLALSLPSKPSIEAHFELFCPPRAVKSRFLKD